jgi:hypothetical protein
MSAPITKTAIPSVITTQDPSIGQVLSALKDNVEIITGVRRGVPVLTALPYTATTQQMIDTINAIIARLNYQGR